MIFLQLFDGVLSSLATDETLFLRRAGAVVLVWYMFRRAIFAWHI